MDEKPDSKSGSTTLVASDSESSWGSLGPAPWIDAGATGGEGQEDPRVAEGISEEEEIDLGDQGLVPQVDSSGGKDKMAER
jgi:hypothetical protein